MKSPFHVIVLGLVVCAAAFFGFYFLGTAKSRELMAQPQPELAWLKAEFELGEAEYARIAALHEAYLPQCAARCRAIEEQNARLKDLLMASAEVTPEIERVLAERAKMRADCEGEMLRHFFEVSRTMPAEQGRRYLAWVERQTLLREQPMEARHRSPTTTGQTGHAH